VTNDQLLAAWKRKLPNVEPTDQELTAFALGVEVGQVELATQVALVEKCMVAMNENADRGEKAEAELAMLKAQPVQEPVATAYENLMMSGTLGAVFHREVPTGTKLYAAPVQPVQPAPLTVENIRAAGGIVHKDGNIFFTNIDQLNRAIEGTKP